MAIVLRKAIWNWIEVFPAEFVTLCQSQKRLDGGAEILFDYCNNLAADNKKKLYFWPLQTMLLILCPDILFNASMSDRTNSSSKKVRKKCYYFFNILFLIKIIIMILSLTILKIIIRLHFLIH